MIFYFSNSQELLKGSSFSKRIDKIKHALEVLIQQDKLVDLLDEEGYYVIDNETGDSIPATDPGSTILFKHKWRNFKKEYDLHLKEQPIWIE